MTALDLVLLIDSMIMAQPSKWLQLSTMFALWLETL